MFGTQDTAYFVVDKRRDSDVVPRLLGEIFFGVLAVDGWGIYTCYANSRAIFHIYFENSANSAMPFPSLPTSSNLMISFEGSFVMVRNYKRIVTNWKKLISKETLKG